MVEQTPAMHADTAKRTYEQHADYWELDTVFQQIIRVQTVGYTHGTCDAKGVEVLSTIPSREELLAKFLGSIQSPITNFARVIKQIAEKQEA